MFGTEQKTVTRCMRMEEKTNNPFVVVYDWMVTEFGVSKAYLYALLYGLADGGEVYCSIKYLARRANASERQIIRVLNSLEKDGYIKKSSNGKRNKYILQNSPFLNAHIHDKMSPTDMFQVTKCHVTHDKMSPEYMTKCHVIRDKMSCDPYVDNKVIIKYDNKAIRKEREKEKELENAISQFIDFRKKIKKPMTDHAVELLRKKLDELADNDTDKIKILEQSVLHGLTGVYALDRPQPAANRNKANKDNVGFEPSYDMDKIKERIKDNTDIF